MRRVRLECLDELCKILAKVLASELRFQPTLYLLEALPMQASNMSLLFPQGLQAVIEGIRYCDVVGVIVPSAIGVVERSLHFANPGNDGLCFVNHFLLFGIDEANLVVEGLGESREELSQKELAHGDSQRKSRNPGCLPRTREPGAHVWRRQFRQTGCAAGQYCY